MKKTLLLCVVASLVIIVNSCARGISPYEAANGKAKCGRSLR